VGVVLQPVEGDAGGPRLERLHDVPLLAEGLFGRGVAGTLDIGPSVVASRLDEVELIVLVLAMLGSVDAAVRPDAEALGIPVAPGVDVAVAEGVVLGNGAVRVEPENLAVEAAEVLAVVRLGGISGGHQEGVVGKPEEPASVVDLGARQGEKFFLIDEFGAVPLKHAQVLGHVELPIAIHDPHAGILRKVGVEHHAQQAGLARTVEGDVEVEDRGVLTGQRIDADDAPFAFAAPEHVVTSPGDFPGNLAVVDEVGGVQRGVADREGVLGLEGESEEQEGKQVQWFHGARITRTSTKGCLRRRRPWPRSRRRGVHRLGPPRPRPPT